MANNNDIFNGHNGYIQYAHKLSENQVNVCTAIDAVTCFSNETLDYLNRSVIQHANNRTNGYELYDLNSSKYQKLQEWHDFQNNQFIDTKWIKISTIGISEEKKPSYYFDILRQILNAFNIPGADLLFLVRVHNGICSINIGFKKHSHIISESEANFLIDQICNFIMVSLPGTQCNVEDNDEGEVSRFMESRYEKEYAITGIPSLNLQNDFPSTIEYLIGGSHTGDLAYLVVARPSSQDDLRKITNSCRDIQGKISSIKNYNISDSRRKGTSSSVQDSSSKGHSTTKFDSQGVSGGLSYIASLSTSYNEGKSNGENSSSTHGISNSISEDESLTLGRSIINVHAEVAANNLLKFGNRIELGQAVGMWNVGCYLFVDEHNLSSPIFVKSLLSGSKSELEPIRLTEISSFVKHERNNNKVVALPFIEPPKLIIGQHSSKLGSSPEVVYHPLGQCFSELTTILTTEELSAMINFPMHSVAGILVRSVPSFGREVIDGKLCQNQLNSSDKLEIGHLVHMGQHFEDNRVCLSKQKLSSHMFVCGTTGSGKSNTIYYLLDKLITDGKKVLIIEPAKGEYKFAFGGRKDFLTFSTNSSVSNLLRINPFSFPQTIHVEEHIERLLDIFNACWPMYAAMPAVLKESINRAYKNCGWDLIESTNEYGLYPTFSDVINELNNYINESHYSSDSKGDYKGALETRLKSLSTGIIGEVFSGEYLSDEALFDSNCIVDLSRLGSTETKSLIMGLLVLKLTEHRISQRDLKKISNNHPLSHITVLEEAHNLLKATNTSQSQESSNLIGKSVEMISSSIAEMRTYGEGFIIADQSPSLLDRSVISNTNTKIIMAMPSKNDREIAGDSIGLTTAQEKEISRMETGYAIVYQKGWQEPVMTKIDYFDKHNPIAFINNKNSKSYQSDAKFLGLLRSSFVNGQLINSSIIEEVLKLSSMDSVKYKMIQHINRYSEDCVLPSILFAEYVGISLFEECEQLYKSADNIGLFNQYIITNLNLIDSYIANNQPYFLSMYIKGCSIIQYRPSVYEIWQQLTNKSE